jgi:hypothetical protein
MKIEVKGMRYLSKKASLLLEVSTHIPSPGDADGSPEVKRLNDGPVFHLIWSE